MANPKHTPGPWTIQKPLNKICVWSNGGVVAEMKHDNKAANAALIAAAPSLLKAVELALLEFDRISYQKKANPEILGLLNAAIRKAKGEI